MDCLVTLNLGGYLCDNARESFLAAASRWQVDYVEVTTPIKPDINPCYTKPALLHRLKHYDHVAYFDADILIRDDAPNPFVSFNDDLFYAVRDISAIRFSTHSIVLATRS